MRGLKVAIVGRTNVGKSSIFNALLGVRRAVVHSREGVTRDIIYGWREFNGLNIVFMDTAGYLDNPTTGLTEAMRDAMDRAISEADLILFVVDLKEGLTPLDHQLAEYLHKVNKVTILVMNKGESHRSREEDFQLVDYLGFQYHLITSATHRMNIHELLFMISDLVSEGRVKLRDIPTPKLVRKLGIIGRPNVGKSSLLNALLGERISIISEIPGTTRDVIDVLCELNGKDFLIIDTPGLRRKARIRDELEAFSARRALGTIKYADILLLVLDSTEGLTRQDKRLAGLVSEREKGLIIAVNKIDLIEDIESNMRSIEEGLNFVNWAPLIPISALKKTNLDELIAIILEVDRQMSFEYQHSSFAETITLKELVHELLISVPMPKDESGIRLRLKDVEQVSTYPPTFKLKFNLPLKEIPKSICTYLKNALRDTLNIPYTPIRLIPG